MKQILATIVLLLSSISMGAQIHDNDEAMRIIDEVKYII